MNRLWVVVVFVVVFMGGTAQAEERKLYFSASASINQFMEIDDSGLIANFDPGYGFLFAFGVDNGKYRFEGELGYRTADIDELGAFGFIGDGNGDMSVLSIMGNGYYDFESPNSNWTPYVGAGIGIIDSDLEGSGPFFTVTGGNTNLAYQVMLGLGYEVSSSLIVTAGYRFLGTFGFEENVMLNELNLGVRFMFN